jgi:hypothetical protein
MEWAMSARIHRRSEVDGLLRDKPVIESSRIVVI